MKCSELRKKLKKIIKKHGDFDVVIANPTSGDYVYEILERIQPKPNLRIYTGCHPVADLLDCVALENEDACE